MTILYHSANPACYAAAIRARALAHTLNIDEVTIAYHSSRGAPTPPAALGRMATSISVPDEVWLDAFPAEAPVIADVPHVLVARRWGQTRLPEPGSVRFVRCYLTEEVSDAQMAWLTAHCDDVVPVVLADPPTDEAPPTLPDAYTLVVLDYPLPHMVSLRRAAQVDHPGLPVVLAGWLPSALSPVARAIVRTFDLHAPVVYPAPLIANAAHVYIAGTQHSHRWTRATADRTTCVPSPSGIDEREARCAQ